MICFHEYAAPAKLSTCYCFDKSISGVNLKEWCFIFRLNTTLQQCLKQLPPTLHIKARVAITGYSKVSRGLHDPLGIFGLHTEESVRKVLARDSGQLVTPFMHVVNQTTRYFAHKCYFPHRGTNLQY